MNQLLQKIFAGDRSSQLPCQKDTLPSLSTKKLYFIAFAMRIHVSTDIGPQVSIGPFTIPIVPAGGATPEVVIFVMHCALPAVHNDL